MADKKFVWIKKRKIKFSAFLYMDSNVSPSMSGEDGNIIVSYVEYDGTHYKYKATSYDDITRFTFDDTTENRNNLKKFEIKNMETITSLYQSFYLSGTWGGLGVENIIFLPDCGGENCTNMSKAFYNCKKLNSVDLNGMDTSYIDNVTWAFTFSKIPEFSFSGNDWSSLTSLNQMFYSTGSTTFVDLSSLDANNITNYDRLFYKCGITHVKMPSNMNTVQPAANMYGLFKSCGSLECIDRLDTTNATDTSSMFDDCDNLTAPDSTTQTSLLNGASWVNSGSCP